MPRRDSHGIHRDQSAVLITRLRAENYSDTPEMRGSKFSAPNFPIPRKSAGIASSPGSSNCPAGGASTLPTDPWRHTSHTRVRPAMPWLEATGARPSFIPTPTVRSSLTPLPRPATLQSSDLRSGAAGQPLPLGFRNAEGQPRRSHDLVPEHRHPPHCPLRPPGLRREESTGGSWPAATAGAERENGRNEKGAGKSARAPLSITQGHRDVPPDARAELPYPSVRRNQKGRKEETGDGSRATNGEPVPVNCQARQSRCRPQTIDRARTHHRQGWESKFPDAEGGILFKVDRGHEFFERGGVVID